MADASNTDSVEIWKPVPGWEGLYSISSMGNVRSEGRVVNVLTRWGHRSPRRWPVKLLKQQVCKGGHMGYMMVHLKEASRGREAHYVHRLVCRTFLGEPQNGQEAAHGDGDPKNNRLANLRWATPAENMEDKLRHGKVPSGERHKFAKLTDAAVRDIRSAKGATTDRDLARQYGVSQATVHAVRIGRTWKHVKAA